MSRERGEQSTARTGTNTDYNVWRCVFEHPKETMPEANASASYFPYRLVHTLGYLNSSYGQPQPSPSPYHVGGPAKPFPWIRWNNRPFTSALELMEVPASTPGRLLMEFNYVVPGISNSPYDTSPNSNPRTRQFTHLLNFFHASDPSNRNAETADDFYQIFEFVHVPSPFVGTETMLDPSVFHTPGPNNPMPGAVDSVPRTSARRSTG